MAARRRWIEKIKNKQYELYFYVLEGGLEVEFVDHTDYSHGCEYHFSLTPKDWIDAIKLVNSIKAQMEKEAHDRPPAK